MFKFVLKRLLMLVPTLFGVVTLVFFMVALAPGDPARVMLGERASPEKLEALRIDLGLNKPLIVQYGNYLGRIIRFDFGTSITTGQPVMEEVRDRFPATVELAFFAMIIATFAGVWLGVLSATRRNSWIDLSSMSMALIGVSMPVFWLGLVMIMIFSVGLDLFPTGGRIDVRMYFQPATNFYLIDTFIVFLKTGDISFFTSALHHLILPALTLGTIPLAIIARTTRSSMLEVLRQDYVKTARSAGIKERRVVYRYALRNALLPVVTVVGIQFGMLLSGAILTETIFAWPGIGKWLYHAISARDFPAVQGGIVVISTTFVLINLVVDILYSLINPRIRLQ